MKILVTGSNGQLGRAIAKQFKDQHDLILHDIETLNITEFNEVNVKLQSELPDVIINAAAYTNVEKAEEEIEQAFKINAIGAQNLAIVAKKIQAKLFHISTDYVFDGKKGCIYNEFDTPNPLSIYGESKYWGELLIQQSGCKCFILRTSWLYGDGNNFVRTMLRLSENKDEISVVSDQYGSPTYTKDLALVIEKLMYTDFYGLYHASNNGVCSWDSFAKKVFEITDKSTKIKSISTEEYPSKALRPKYSVMENKMLQLRGIDMRSWEEALTEFLIG
ncbi:dTDP-4-dehydrorhamnose reductase [Dendrosporobacter sp. 1207_IL3150]|uniref:dTDP-4-dehydrorhamnose reductase n=1 Tax=Dendrosporobacter sp. 1207_IL3150 TaxID=3084054 RepID=UPI002FD88318